MFERKLLKRLNLVNYNLMVVIGGRRLSEHFCSQLNLNYKFKKILYQWDSLGNYNYSKLIPYFDVVKTFDFRDSFERNLEYLQLFYKNQQINVLKQDIDLLFVGIWHSDRIQILEKFADTAEKNGLSYQFRVYCPWYIYFYLGLIKRRISPSMFLTFKKIPLNLTQNLYQRARAVIDISHPNQTGLTMRTIETIGNGKKLITTNKYISQELFYNEKMIQIFDRQNPQIDIDFLSINDCYENINHLEISNWVKELLR